MKLRGIHLIAATTIAASLAFAAFTLDTFRTLPTSIAGTTTNLCTNVTFSVDGLDTISMQFGCVLSNTGNSTFTLAFTRGQSSNTMDTGTFSTWTFSTAGWAKGVTNYASTNLFSVRDFRTLGVYSIANGNTSTAATVSLGCGSK